VAAPSLVRFQAPSRRLVPRYPLQASLDVIVLRSGVPCNIPARCCDLSEAGLGAIVAADLAVGQSVALEMRLPNVGLPVRARAVVRYQEPMRCGLQFVGLADEQREKIRYWAVQSAAPEAPSSKHTSEIVAAVEPPNAEIDRPSEKENARRFRGRNLVVLLALLTGLAALGWWNWQSKWSELEQQPVSQAPAAAQPDIPLRVAPEAMERLVVYRVDPIYPETARQAGSQGLVVLNAVIAADGTVKRLRPVAGPDQLSQSALDAVQYWRYSPYRAQGKPVEVETTVSVNFRLP
jgi:TonB family protein